MSVAQVSPDVTFTVAQGLVFLAIIVAVGLVACLAFIAEDLAEWRDERRFQRELRS